MPFKPGQSGNPSGRPKTDPVLVFLARKHTAQAVDVLVKVMRDKKAAPSARVSAASEILDRGWGRAPQEIQSDAKTFGLSAILEIIRGTKPSMNLPSEDKHRSHEVKR